jgi:hypothetical protein
MSRWQAGTILLTLAALASTGSLASTQKTVLIEDFVECLY